MHLRAYRAQWSCWGRVEWLGALEGQFERAFEMPLQGEVRQERGRESGQGRGTALGWSAVCTWVPVPWLLCVAVSVAGAVEVMGFTMPPPESSG